MCNQNVLKALTFNPDYLTSAKSQILHPGGMNTSLAKYDSRYILCFKKNPLKSNLFIELFVICLTFLLCIFAAYVQHCKFAIQVWKKGNMKCQVLSHAVAAYLITLLTLVALMLNFRFTKWMNLFLACCWIWYEGHFPLHFSGSLLHLLECSFSVHISISSRLRCD